MSHFNWYADGEREREEQDQPEQGWNTPLVP